MRQQNVVVRGSVVDETTRGPVTGARVYAISPSDVRQTESDAKGNFIFLTLLPGTYHLCASKVSYAIDCSFQEPQLTELFAGLEYGATIVLSHAMQ
jgi:hypothetical protein